MRKQLALCAAALAATLAGAQAPTHVETHPTQGQAGTGAWIDVPFISQPREGCGAAALSMVMQYWAEQQKQQTNAADRDVGRIQKELYVPREHGIPASAMQSYLKQHGFRVFALSGRWSDIEEQIRKGRPLIVAIRPEGQREFHYVVIDGVDPARGLVMMNDPAERKLLPEERAAFEKAWNATNNWMLLAVPSAGQSGGH